MSNFSYLFAVKERYSKYLARFTVAAPTEEEALAKLLQWIESNFPADASIEGIVTFPSFVRPAQDVVCTDSPFWAGKTIGEPKLVYGNPEGYSKMVLGLPWDDMFEEET